MTIKELRMTSGLSQSKFAKKYHIPVRRLQAWEQGARTQDETIAYLIERVMRYEGELELREECYYD